MAKITGMTKMVGGVSMTKTHWKIYLELFDGVWSLGVYSDGYIKESRNLLLEGFLKHA